MILVSDPDLHRSVVITGLPKPSDIDLSPKSVGASALVTILFLLLVSFPGALLDSTVDQHYNEIRGWLRLKPRAEKVFRERSSSFRGLALVGFLLAGGVAGAFLDPSVGPSATTAALIVGLATSLAVVFICFGLPGIIYMRRHHQDRGQILLRPGSLVLTAAMVLTSRALQLEPGFLFGLIGGLAFGTSLTPRSRGRLAVVTSIFTLGVGLTAWFLWAPVSAIAAQGDATFWLIVAEAALAGTFIAAVETLIIGLIPMQEFDGGTIKAWKFLDWAAVYSIGAYAYVLIVLRPGSSSGSDNNGAPWKALLIAVSFAAISTAFWAYFRLRPASWGTRDADPSSASVGPGSAGSAAGKGTGRPPRRVPANVVRARPTGRAKSRIVGVLLLAVALLAFAFCRDGRSTAITIGAFNFPESAILSNIYGGALRNSGFDVKFRTNLGSRETVGPALQNGDIDAYLGYAATDLEFWNDSAGRATPDAAETLSRLNDVLQPKALLALDPARAVNQNTFAVTQATADRLGITKLSELGPLASQLTLGGPPECPTRPFCAMGLETTYGIRFKSFTALDAGGPLTKAALRNGDIDVALLFTSDATGFVLLEDDKQLQNADAVVPVIRPDKVDDRARSVMNDVSAKLTTESLSKLNERFTATGGDTDVVAKTWLRENGFT